MSASTQSEDDQQPDLDLKIDELHSQINELDEKYKAAQAALKAIKVELDSKWRELNKHQTLKDYIAVSASA